MDIIENETIEMFPESSDPVNELIREGDKLFSMEELLRNAIITIALECPDNDSRRSLLTDIGLSTNDRCFALCERIRELFND